MFPHNKKWTPAHDRILRDGLAAGRSVPSLVPDLGVCESVAYYHLRRLKLRTPRHPMAWPAVADQELNIRWSRGESAATIAAALGVTRNAVIGRRYRLALGRQLGLAPRWGRPPGQRKPRPSRPQKMLAAVAAPYLRRSSGQQPTKDELRAQLTQAVLNTGGRLVR